MLAGGSFFGLMNSSGGSFAYDGAGKLTVTLEKGQALTVYEHTDAFAAWDIYSAGILGAAPHTETFWHGPEYCTWVEQGHAAKLHGK